MTVFAQHKRELRRRQVAITLWAIAVVLALAALSRPTFANETLPVNPAVTPDNVMETICVSGYSHSIRPPSQVTNAIKKQLLDEAGIPREFIHDYVLDHVIPISSGGAPDDIRNLRLEPREESFLKDRAENRSHDLICTGRLGLREAQAAMWHNWRRLLPARAAGGF
jgi:hypothetical protein